MPDNFPATKCNEWTATIDNVGRIQHAVIETAPLLLLLGKNNTGKSYAASVLWALADTDIMDDRRLHGDVAYPKFFLDFLQRAEKADTCILAVDASVRREIKAYFNECWAADCADLLSSVFAVDGFAQSRVQINSDCNCDFSLELLWKPQRSVKGRVSSDLNVYLIVGGKRTLYFPEVPTRGKKGQLCT